MIDTWLKNPEKMGADAVAKLPELIEKYPYCATYRLLYVVALANVHSTRLEQELRLHSVALPERTKLFQMVNKGEYEWVSLMQQLDEARRNKPEVNDFELIDKFLSTVRDNQGNEISYNVEDIVSNPTIVNEDFVEEDGPSIDIDPTQDELIDNFLLAESQGTLFVPQAEPTIEDEDGSSVVDRIADRAFLTESLAKVYVKQHKYEQALAIFLELNLKYPKKNCYFADQIRYLEKIIEYQKQK